jgi:hypothetical protein
MFSDFFSENRAVYEIKSKNVVEPERMQTTWYLRVTYCISKPTRAQAHARLCVPTHTHTHTHTQKYVILIAFHAPQCYVTCTLSLFYTNSCIGHPVT